ncbi:biotin transporter BioY [Corynebacterium auriscanis]|uniref:biotin transporter BioY n=1 Tax=Corynebacterium auriscanis TaxID=99807 RepID=UPI002247FF8C|nr:biotin transporter BioY [Corynebacterium auriscanis]MCX2162996.1 biotin transporter BioY [Corynebacterium auriscanis]WJY72857.1 Biotin transporter BioY [Corynebacterium auriscanis]
MKENNSSHSTGFGATDLALIAVFAALIIVLGAVSIPVGTAGVPIVLQNMGILLAAFILGGTRGGLAVALFLGVGLVGVPNLAGWRPTLAALPGPTVGYLVGYLVTAFLIGYAADRIIRSHRRSARSPIALLVTLIILGLAGIAIQYLCGTIGLMARTPLDFTAALATNAPFIPGDLAKAVVAAIVAAGAIRAVPDLIPTAKLPIRHTAAND